MTAIPRCLSHLPVFAGMPVPYFTDWPPGGKPNFRAHSTVRHRECMERRLCGICGLGLGYWIAFCAGPESIKIRSSYMPAAHPECNDAALQICPYLATEERDRSGKPGDGIIPRDELPPKPSRIAVVLSRSYEILRANGTEYAKWAPPKSVRWFTYRDGALVPE